MIDIADAAVAGVCVQYRGGFDGPFDATAMASSSVSHTRRFFRGCNFSPLMRICSISPDVSHRPPPFSCTLAY